MFCRVISKPILKLMMYKASMSLWQITVRALEPLGKETWDEETNLRSGSIKSLKTLS